MSLLKSSPNAPRPLKVASLVLAIFIAGLLAGCNASTDLPETHVAGTPNFSASDVDLSSLPPSLDSHEVPALHHPPSTRRLKYGSVHTNPPRTIPASHNRS
jgi:hypothetical protein